MKLILEMGIDTFKNHVTEAFNGMELEIKPDWEHTQFENLINSISREGSLEWGKTNPKKEALIKWLSKCPKKLRKVYFKAVSPRSIRFKVIGIENIAGIN